MTDRGAAATASFDGTAAAGPGGFEDGGPTDCAGEARGFDGWGSGRSSVVRDILDAAAAAAGVPPVLAATGSDGRNFLASTALAASISARLRPTQVGWFCRRSTTAFTLKNLQ